MHFCSKLTRYLLNVLLPLISLEVTFELLLHFYVLSVACRSVKSRFYLISDLVISVTSRDGSSVLEFSAEVVMTEPLYLDENLCLVDAEA